MKELQPNLLDDYEHTVQGQIERHDGEPGFPKLDDYRLTKKMVDDYLYDYQIVVDREGSQRSQLTAYGISPSFRPSSSALFPSRCCHGENGR